MELHDLNDASTFLSTSPDTDPPQTPALSSRKLLVIIGSLYLGTFLVALDTTIIGTALPAITAQFHALDDLAWYGSAYLLALTALQPTFGKLYKIFCTKILYIVSIAVFEFGSILCAAAPSSVVFIIGRAVAGCGAAGLMQGSFAIITRVVPLSKRPFYFGLFVSAFGLSIGIGPVLGGMLADRGIWRWCFWINLPLGAAVLLLVVIFLKIPDTKGQVKGAVCSTKRFLFQLDLGGSFLLVTSICCLFLAMQWGGQHLPWSSPRIIGLFVASMILFTVFLIVEWRMGDHASVPFRVLKQRSIASGALYLFLFAMPNFSYGVYIPIFFQEVKGFSAQRSGAELLFLALTQILVVVVVGALVSVSGYYTPFIIGGTALSVVGSGLITQLNSDTSHSIWVVYFLVCGMGTGSAINLPYTAVSVVLEEADMVTGNALLQFAFQLGGAISLSISQSFFLAHAGPHGVPAPSGPDNWSDSSKFAHQSATHNVFVFLLFTAGLAFLASFGFEHKNVITVERERKLVSGSITQEISVS